MSGMRGFSAALQGFAQGVGPGMQLGDQVQDAMDKENPPY